MNLNTLLVFLLVTPLSAFGAKVSFVKGDVSVNGKAASIGQNVSQGSRVKTGKKGHAVVELGTGREIKLDPSTSIRVARVTSKKKPITINLDRGGMIAKIKKGRKGKGFVIRTKSATMGVRGTHFYAAVAKKKDVWMCVNEGSVEIKDNKSGQKVVVPEGKGVFAPLGKKITKPRPFAWTKKINWNMDPKSGDVKNEISIDANYDDLEDLDYD